MPQGIDAPATVPEGTTSSISVSASRSSKVLISNPRTGEVIERPVDANGDAQFELLPGWVSGDTLTVVDADDPLKNTLISITPASVATIP